MKNSYITFTFLVLLLLPLVISQTSDQTYVFRIQKEGLYVNPVSLTLFDSPFDESSNLNEGSYELEVVSENSILYILNFSLYTILMGNPSEECFENPNSSDCNEQPYFYDESFGEAILNLPYYNKATSINVYGPEGLIFVYPLEADKESFFKDNLLFISLWFS